MIRTLTTSALIAGLLLASACGPAEDHTVRVTVEGTREGEALEFELGGVEMGSDVVLYAALFRIGSVTASSNDDESTESQAINVDLFQRTVVAELELGGDTLSGLTLTVPVPEGDGVRRGESLSVVIGGTLKGVPFEYRDDAMQPLEVAAGSAFGADTTVAAVRFDMKQWLREIDESDLTLTGGQYLIDATRNAAAAAQIEAAIRASLRLDTSGQPLCRDCDDS